ncbi:hypothetical protein [Paraburkholderia terrae]|uniref:hypothetical protein n=1 Tax=Paraburkholderia terrae TaxID=311230 RepID=UPI001EE15F35|nr:hypothetical protein [Paraburkholderia terrae]GJH00235.1 hypothetical protein CBA19C8_06780 [Paraburkholderia terrae]
MNVSTVAERLRALGIQIKSTAEPTLTEDGAVYLNERVYVAVPVFGGGLNVVRTEGEGDKIAFVFYPDRLSIAGLQPDIERALKDDAAAQGDAS